MHARQRQCVSHGFQRVPSFRGIRRDYCRGKTSSITTGARSLNARNEICMFEYIILKKYHLNRSASHEKWFLFDCKTSSGEKSVGEFF